MGILNSIKLKFFSPYDTAQSGAKISTKPEGAAEEKKETSYVSKESAQALQAQAQAGLNIASSKQDRVRTLNAEKLIGKMFPEIDEKEVTQNYINFRKEARRTALLATKKLYPTFTTGQMNDYLNKKGQIIATFEFPEKKEGQDALSQDCCSYLMKEYDPDTKELKAITRVFNHDGFGTHWPKRGNPRMERIEFGKTPEETTFLKARFEGKHEGEKFTLSPKVELYAKGYQTDGTLFGERKADKWLSTTTYHNWESYRENYTAKGRIFDGCTMTGYHPNKTQEGGLEGESFDRGLEYPTKQLKIGDTILTSNYPYIYEKKD